MAESLVFDPTSEDATNTPLTLTAGAYTVAAMEFPAPPVDPRYTNPADTDGERLVATRYQNREITLQVGIVGSTAGVLNTATNVLTAKIAKLNREGGTLQWTLEAGGVVTADALEAAISVTTDIGYSAGHFSRADIKIKARPFMRGVETNYSSHPETTLPVLVFTETPGPAGDVPALGRLVLTEASGADQASVVFGVQSRRYDSATSAALFYEAEGRTVLNTAAIATVTGASGGGTNNAVTEGILTPVWAGVLSTQAAGGGAHLTHIGSYRVLARLQRPTTNTGAVSVALDWAVGDLRAYTRNPVAAFVANDNEGQWQQIDLGIVNIPKSPVGSQRWEGRIVAKSTIAGDDLIVDCIWLVPIDECSGEIDAVTVNVAPTAYSARDEFDQSAGSAAGKTLPVGGTWTGAGDADDFTIDTTGHTLQRTAVSDAATSLATARLLTASTPTTLTNTHAQVTWKAIPSAANLTAGLLLRYVNANNFLAVIAVMVLPDQQEFSVVKRVASVETTLKITSSSTLFGLGSANDVDISADVNASGAFSATVWGGVGFSPVTITGTDTDLATGGTLAAGTVGVIDQYTSATAKTRKFDNFSAYATVLDAAVFASQSAEIRHDGVFREDSAGTIYAPVSKYEGELLTIPPAGAGARSLRVIAKASRGHVDGLDPAIDDLTGQLYVTPRYLVVPS